MPSMGFLSASHDCTVRLWAFNNTSTSSGCETLSIMVGHTALVYAVAAAQPNTIVAMVNPGAVLTPWSSEVQVSFAVDVTTGAVDRRSDDSNNIQNILALALGL